MVWPQSLIVCTLLNLNMLYAGEDGVTRFRLFCYAAVDPFSGSYSRVCRRTAISMGRVGVC